MPTVNGERVRLLMDAQNIKPKELLHLMHQTVGNERLTRPTLSKIINNSYEGEPSTKLVKGLAQILGTTIDYLTGEGKGSGSVVAYRPYDPADLEEVLLRRLEKQNIQLARIMRAVQRMPEKEREVILGHIERQLDLLADYGERMADDTAEDTSDSAETDNPGRTYDGNNAAAHERKMQMPLS